MTKAGHKGLTAVVLVLTALLTGGCTRSAVPDASAVPNGTPSAVPDASAVPSGTPSAAGTTSAAVDVRRVDWASATIRLPDGRDDKDCPVGAVTLTDGRWAESGKSGPGEIRGSYRDGPATYGDLDGDGRAEAVVHVSCWAAGGDSGDSSGQLLVVSGRSGSLRGMGYVGPLAQVYGSLRISEGRLRVTVTRKYSDVRQVRTYEWDGRRFTQVDGPTEVPGR